MKTISNRMGELYRKALGQLPEELFNDWLMACFGMFEGIASLNRATTHRDVDAMEGKLNDLLATYWIQLGHCHHCGGEIKSHQHVTMLTDSPPDPVEACVDCGRKVD